MKLCNILLVFVMMALCACRSDKLVIFAPSTVSVIEDEWIDDPSLVPLAKEDIFYCGERYRVVGDFNGDGIDDMALSLGECGGMRGDFSGYALYLGRADGKFKRVGEIGAYASSLRVEKLWGWDKPDRLWWQSRMGGSRSYIHCAVVSDEGVKKEGALYVYGLGDGGTALGNSLVTLCSQRGDVDLRVEKSKTVDGIVTWHP